WSEQLGEVDLFATDPPSVPEWRLYRRWAFESAALDLALRQAGVSLAEALGREPQPVRFVVSLRLGEPPSAEPVRRLLGLYAPPPDHRTVAALRPPRDRFTWDAVVHSAADVDALPFPPRMLNCKPSRFGGVRALFDFYDLCMDRAIGLYGGGQFELGPGRGQIQ